MTGTQIPPTRRLAICRLVAIVAVGFVGLASCSESSGPPPNPSAPLTRPPDAGHCGAASEPSGSDPGLVAGILWPSGAFAAGARVTAYACIGPPGEVEFFARGSATVYPRTVERDPRGDGVLRLTVSAARAGTTDIGFTLRHGALIVTHQVSCKVVSDGTSWHFSPPH
jgi:hypothetical protein